MGDGNAFDFLERPPRTKKPRKLGITCVTDRSFSLLQCEQIVETAGDIIDHMKIHDHVGVMWRWDLEWLQKKNAYYASQGIDTTTGGIPFEIAFAKGLVPEFMDRIKEAGFSSVEVSGDSLDLPQSDRTASIRHAVERGLGVFAELGRKFPDQPLDPQEGIDMGRQDLEDGVHLVVMEASEIKIVMRDGGDALHRITEELGPENLIFEVGINDDWMEIGKWLIREFGPDVNIESVYSENAYIIEAMRHGLSRGIDYEYFHQFEGKNLPMVEMPSGK